MGGRIQSIPPGGAGPNPRQDLIRSRAPPRNQGWSSPRMGLQRGAYGSFNDQSSCGDLQVMGPKCLLNQETKQKNTNAVRHHAGKHRDTSNYVLVLLREHPKHVGDTFTLPFPSLPTTSTSTSTNHQRPEHFDASSCTGGAVSLTASGSAIWVGGILRLTSSDS